MVIEPLKWLWKKKSVNRNKNLKITKRNQNVFSRIFIQKLTVQRKYFFDRIIILMHSFYEESFFFVCNRTQNKKNKQGNKPDLQRTNKCKKCNEMKKGKGGTEKTISKPIRSLSGAIHYADFVSDFLDRN